jgi:hypothetical protein
MKLSDTIEGGDTKRYRLYYYFVTFYSEKSVWLVLQILYFSFKSYRQVLTPVNNSQLLLKMEILDKLRLVTFHTTATQIKFNVITGSYQFRINYSSHDLDSQCQNEDARCLGVPFSKCTN